MNCVESKKMLKTKDIYVRSPTYVGLNVELWEDVLKMLVESRARSRAHTSDKAGVKGLNMYHHIH